MADLNNKKTVREHIEEFAQDAVEGIKTGVHNITEKIKETKDNLFNKSKNVMNKTNLEEFSEEIQHNVNDAGKNIAEYSRETFNRDNLEEFAEEANHKITNVGNYIREAGNNLVDDIETYSREEYADDYSLNDNTYNNANIEFAEDVDDVLDDMNEEADRSDNDDFDDFNKNYNQDYDDDNF